MRKLLSILLLIFAFSCVGFAADVELDYFEYADDAAAQLEYVSSTTIPNPLLHYKMNDDAANTTVTDAMGYANGVALSNTNTMSVAGKINDALEFDGLTEYIDVALIRVSQTYTFTAWVYIEGTAPEQYHKFLDARASSGAGYVHYDKTSGVISGQHVDGVATNVMATDGWHHIASAVTLDITEKIVIGSHYGHATNFVGGKIDDWRLYTGTLTLNQIKAIYNNGTGTESQNPVGGDLMCFSESTIKQQGSCSLKVIAAQTDSLNDILTRTVDPTIDLTGKDEWIFYIYSSRTGSNIKAGIHDSGGTTTENTPNVTSSGAWQKVTVDVSGVADADKNAIDEIKITVVNADAANTFYFDWMYGGDEVIIEHPTTSQLLLGGMWFKDGKLQYSDWCRFKRGTDE